ADGGRLQLAGHRALCGERHPLSRLLRHHGGHAHGLHHLRLRQSARRHRLRPARPAHLLWVDGKFRAVTVRMAGDTTIMTADEVAAVADRRRQMRRQWGRLFGNPLSAVGLALSAAFIVMAIAAPLLASHDPLAMDPSKRLAAPSALHWFGTDDGGRDVLARVIYGTRSSLLTALGILSLASVVGTGIGLAAGYFGGWLDKAWRRTSDMFLAFPALVLAMGLPAALGPSLFNAMLATAVVWWPWYARPRRARALPFKKGAFVRGG